jgi:hypothetical protein
MQRSHEEALLNWMHDESNTMTGEVLHGHGNLMRFSHEKEKNVITFIINNSQCITMFLDEFNVNFIGEPKGLRREKARKTTDTS